MPRQPGPFEHNTYIRFPLDVESEQMQWNMSCQDKPSNNGTCVGECRLCVDRSQFLPEEKFEENKMKVMTNFRESLHAIKNKTIYRWVVDVMAKLPDYFWEIPASSTGKYHSESESGVGGLMRHTQNIAKIAMILLDNPMYDYFTHIQKDCIIAAALLHDGIKNGLPKQKWTQQDHPLLPELLDLSTTKKEIEQRSSIRGKIFRMVRSHQGPWTSNGLLPAAENDQERFLHLCDYLASRREINISQEQP